MPKKTTTARGGAQRHRPRVQKSVELVRQTSSQEKEVEVVESASNSEPAPPAARVSTATKTAKSVKPAVASPTPTPEDEMVTPTSVANSGSAAASPGVSIANTNPTAVSTGASVANTDAVTTPRGSASTSEEILGRKQTIQSAGTAPRGSASARLAARRQNAQRVQQRSAPSLITPEHYAYVRRDLIFIAILAAIMFSIIIILHFVPAIGG